MPEEYVTIVTRKGQITVPARVRRVLNLKVGDKVAVALDGEDAATARLVPSVTDMTFGAVKPRERPKRSKGIRRAFEEHASDRDERVRGDSQTDR